MNDRGGRPLLGSTYTAAQNDYFVCSGQDESPRMQLTTYEVGGNSTTHYVGVSLDANYRWKYKNEYDQDFQTTVNCDQCKGIHNQEPTEQTEVLTKNCPNSCKIKSLSKTGADNSYEKYGITGGNVSNSIKLKYMFDSSKANEGQWRQGGSRVYLTELINSQDETSGTSRYFPIRLGTSGQEEISITLDVSKVPCGFNAAVYLVAMDLSPGLKLHDCGVGYADAQCPTDLAINADGITAGAALGGPEQISHCATELDLFEVNREASAFTMHACDENTGGVHSMCRDGQSCNERCDSNGCDWNSYRLSEQTQDPDGARSIFGTGSSNDIDTTQPFTVRTWYDKEANSWNQKLIQGEVSVSVPEVTFQTGTSSTEHNSTTDDFCDAFDTHLGGNGAGNLHTMFGGNQRMVDAQNEGYVLVLSIWTEDNNANPPMQWLDGTEGDSNAPGAVRGRCSSDPWTWGTSPLTVDELMEIEVTYSNIKIGPIGTTG